MVRWFTLYIGLLLVGVPLQSVSATLPADIACHVGIYRLANGSDLDIGLGDDGNLRWRQKDGTTGQLKADSDGQWASSRGWTGQPDGISASFDSCSADGIRFGGAAGRRIKLQATDEKFPVVDATLAGRLVMPEGAGPFPIVILVHGSEHDSALDRYPLQRLLPSEGIGVFVYDKRGTGQSTGQYTQDYLTLANDAIAAMREAKRLAGSRAGRLGYFGASQGGWVAPLAARIEPVDFVVVGFGLAVSPLEEDRSAIALDMTRHGFGPDEVKKAMEVANATAAILTSGFQDG